MSSRHVGLRTVFVGCILLTLFTLVGGTNASPFEEELPTGAPDNLDQAGMLAADGRWSSGWLDIAPGQALTVQHNYGGEPDQYALDMWFRDTDGDLGIHHRAYGGMEVAGRFSGAAWQKLTSSAVEVYRYAHDAFADQVLVRIWVPDPPLWQSGWVDIAPGQVLTMTHNLGGNPDQYVVAMRFRDTDPQGLGVNLRAAGGMEVAGQLYGAAWQQLTANTVQVLRFRDDTVADQVLVQVHQPDPPLYDSGWQDIGAGQQLLLRHDLGGNPVGYIVRGFARDTRPDGRGRNAVYNGGAEANGRFFGSNWEKLTNSTITVNRLPDDDVAHTADQVRVWIYAPRFTAWLPTVMRNFTMSAAQGSAAD